MEDREQAPAVALRRLRTPADPSPDLLVELAHPGRTALEQELVGDIRGHEAAGVVVAAVQARELPPGLGRVALDQRREPRGRVDELGREVARALVLEHGGRRERAEVRAEQ